MSWCLRRMTVYRTALLLIPVLALVAAPVRADPITLKGLTFSDELGGFVIVGGWGSGAKDDPFVIVEHISGSEPAVLAIRGLTMEFGNPARSNHFVGFALNKVVINATGRVWHGFGMGLEERLGKYSNYFDGLSFGQEPDENRSIASDHYEEVLVVDEPGDGMVFSKGVVYPGEQVVFRLIITDNSPKPEFYLVQRRQEAIVSAPEVRPDPG